MLLRVQEHTLHYLCQYPFRRTRYTRVIQQMTFRVFPVAEYIVRHPFHPRFLSPSRCGLQQFHPVQYPAILVLPSTSSRQQLLQNQSPVAYTLLVPVQSAEVIQSPQHRSRQDRASAQSRTRRYCRQQSHLQSLTERLQLFLQRGIPFCTELRQESRQSQSRLRY